MPEVGIGFFPDVGATYALPRLPGEMGVYLALTGDRVRAADAVPLGLATHTASSSELPRIRDTLVDGRPLDDILPGEDRPSAGELLQNRSTIDRCFSAETVSAIAARLEQAAGGSAFAAKTLATIRTKSPTSLAIALEQMRRGRALSFEDAMRTEFRIVSRVIEGRDFYEGVRAAIIDKDGAPRWQPSRLDEVAETEIARYFEPLGAAELEIA
jgi:enoyl-CoA hydratase